jgi:hypothetical protein
MEGHVPPGWVTPENRALARRPKMWGMPREYAALLLVVTLQLGLSLHLFGAAAVVFVAGYLVGRAIDAYDPFAGELFLRQTRIPRVLRP